MWERAATRVKVEVFKSEDGELVFEDRRKGALQSGFKMDVADERFGKLFECHEFVIDTSEGQGH